MWRRVRGVGITLALLLLLVGCSATVTRTPYLELSNGDKLYANTDTIPIQQEVLDYCPDNTTKLQHTYLNFYEGGLQGISNYRQLLLDNGFVEQVNEHSAEVLDSMFYSDDGRVRIIYQVSGTSRIIFEKPESEAHILLKGMEHG